MTLTMYIVWAVALLAMVIDRWRGVELLRSEHAARRAAEAERDAMRAKTLCGHCQRLARAFGEAT